MSSSNLQKIRHIKSRHEHQWLAVSAVQAVGIGRLQNGEYGIIISVDKFEETLGSILPAEIDGVQIEIVETGKFTAL